IEHLAARRLVIAGLQKKNHGDYDGELKQGKSHDAPYRSREQFDYPHGCSWCSARELAGLSAMSVLPLNGHRFCTAPTKANVAV
ncbi:MAG: hypothetical protein WAK67_21145, partial [Xanthobacteraceae bacterium]